MILHPLVKLSNNRFKKLYLNIQQTATAPVHLGDSNGDAPTHFSINTVSYFYRKCAIMPILFPILCCIWTNLWQRFWKRNVEANMLLSNKKRKWRYASLSRMKLVMCDENSKYTAVDIHLIKMYRHTVHTHTHKHNTYGHGNTSRA